MKKLVILLIFCLFSHVQATFFRFIFYSGITYLAYQQAIEGHAEGIPFVKTEAQKTGSVLLKIPPADWADYVQQQYQHVWKPDMVQHPKFYAWLAVASIGLISASRQFFPK